MHATRLVNQRDNGYMWFGLNGLWVTSVWLATKGFPHSEEWGDFSHALCGESSVNNPYLLLTKLNSLQTRLIVTAQRYKCVL